MLGLLGVNPGRRFLSTLSKAGLGAVERVNKNYKRNDPKNKGRTPVSLEVRPLYKVF